MLLLLLLLCCRRVAHVNQHLCGCLWVREAGFRSGRGRDHRHDASLHVSATAEWRERAGERTAIVTRISLHAPSCCPSLWLTLHAVFAFSPWLNSYILSTVNAVGFFGLACGLLVGDEYNTAAILTGGMLAILAACAIQIVGGKMLWVRGAHTTAGL